MRNFGGMLAQAGANIGQQIGSGYANLGRDISSGLMDISGAFRERREKRKEETEQENVQKLLQQYANDPAQLNAMGQKYAIQGKDVLSKLFFDAAKSAVQKETAGQQRGVQGGLMAITQAASRGVPLEELQEAQKSVISLGGTQAQIMEAYKAGAVGDRETVSVSPGGALVDKKTGDVLYERPFKPEAPAKSKGIKTVERDDGSVSVLDADTGDLISTLPPPDKGEGNREAALSLIAQTTSFISDIDKLKDPGFTETGFIGGVTSSVPGTPAYDREKELLSIRARLGFDQINEMKRLAAESGASGTGLGQISNIEFMSLQSTIDAIYVGMSAEAQNEALENIRKHLLNVQKLASGVAPSDAIEWDRPEYKAVGYHKDPETGAVFYAPEGPNGTVYKLVGGKFVKVGA